MTTAFRMKVSRCGILLCLFVLVLDALMICHAPFFMICGAVFPLFPLVFGTNIQRVLSLLLFGYSIAFFTLEYRASQKMMDQVKAIKSKQELHSNQP